MYSSFLFVNPQVQWDEPSAVPKPDRVSPWEIEPFVASAPLPSVQPTVVKAKRPRPSNELPNLGGDLFLITPPISYIDCWF